MQTPLGSGKRKVLIRPPSPSVSVDVDTLLRGDGPDRVRSGSRGGDGSDRVFRGGSYRVLIGIRSDLVLREMDSIWSSWRRGPIEL